MDCLSIDGLCWEGVEMKTKIPKLFYTVGLPGSGKSTWLENNKEKLHINIHSSDSIREELGDVNDQTQNELVFSTLHKRIKEDLLNGKNVAYDATGLKRKNRLAFMREIQNIPCEKICVLFATPYESCLRNNANRDRNVPESVINRMLKSFEVPTCCEGWDHIQIVWWNYEKYGMEFDLSNDMREWCKISHDNPNHTLLIGDHMLAAASHALTLSDDKSLHTAVILHDCGKPFTKDFYNGKGEPTEFAHYYNHQHVGAYLSLFYLREMELSEDEILYISLLVELHMNPFLKWKDSDKAKEKDRKLFGDQTIRDIELLNECDRAAH